MIVSRDQHLSLLHAPFEVLANVIASIRIEVGEFKQRRPPHHINDGLVAVIVRADLSQSRGSRIRENVDLIPQEGRIVLNVAVHLK